MKKFLTGLVAALAFFGGDSAFGQDLTIRFSEGVGGAAGSTAEITCILDFADYPDPSQGWSIGICHDEAQLNPMSAHIEGTATETINGGGPPAFHVINIFENDDVIPAPGTPGVNQAVVIVLVGSEVLPPTDNVKLLVIGYELSGADGFADVTYCETTIGGTGPVENVIVINGTSNAPIMINGQIEVGALASPIYRAPTDLEIDSEVAGSITASISLELPAHDALGFSMGISHDDMVVNLLSITAGTDLNDPDYFAVNINPFNGVGGTVGCVLSLGAPLEYLLMGGTYEVAQFEYEATATAQSLDSSALSFVNTLAGGDNSPPIGNLISTGNAEVIADLNDGLITIAEIIVPSGFLRGNANQDSAFNLADCVFILQYLFAGGDTPACLSTADTNDSGDIDLSDGIFALQFLFSGGAAIPEPFAACGQDPTPDALGCENYNVDLCL